MKIVKTTTHELSFQVSAFWDTEGGMGSDTFGPVCTTIEDAIHHLELANASGTGQREFDWVIVCEVSTKVSKS